LKDDKELPSAPWILKDLSTIQLAEVLVNGKPIKKGLTRLTEAQKKILKALKISKISI